MTRVVLVGLGATGIAIGRSLTQRDDMEVAGAADPRLAGTDLGQHVGLGDLGVQVVTKLRDLPQADLAIVATTSDLTQVAESIETLVDRSFNVLSICEELAYPWRSHPDVARRLDERARVRGVTVVGSGANPGVLMDTLPLLLTCLTQRVSRVAISRRTSMARYGAILSKFGLGLTPEEFTAADAEGQVPGHHGFEQAIGALAAGLGWELDAIEVDRVSPTIITEFQRQGEHVTIEPGQIAAVTHTARGLREGTALIELSIVFGFFADTDPIGVGDDYEIHGAEHTLELSSTTGFESFLSTIAAAVNTATAVVEAQPGLLSMADLTPRQLASKGSLWVDGGAI